jgi:hypothetical protein
MAFTVWRFFRAQVSVGANGGRAPVSRRGFAASPLVLFDRCASGNGAVHRLSTKFPSPRFPRNVSQRRSTMERAIMEVRAHVNVTRAVRCLCGIAVVGVARAGFGRAASVSAAMRPNPAFNADVPWAALRAGPRAAG